MQQSQYEAALPVRCADAFLGLSLYCSKADGSMPLQCSLHSELEFRLKMLSQYKTENPKIHIPVTFQTMNVLQCLDHLLSHQIVTEPWPLFHLQSLLINHHYYWLLVLQLRFLGCNPQCLKKNTKLCLYKISGLPICRSTISYRYAQTHSHFCFPSCTETSLHISWFYRFSPFHLLTSVGLSELGSSDCYIISAIHWPYTWFGWKLLWPLFSVQFGLKAVRITCSHILSCAFRVRFLPVLSEVLFNLA